MYQKHTAAESIRFFLIIGTHQKLLFSQNYIDTYTESILTVNC